MTQDQELNEDNSDRWVRFANFLPNNSLVMHFSTRWYQVLCFRSILVAVILGDLRFCIKYDEWRNLSGIIMVKSTALLSTSDSRAFRVASQISRSKSLRFLLRVNLKSTVYQHEKCCWMLTVIIFFYSFLNC